jgi:CheY-like chemotaxis protein
MPHALVGRRQSDGGVTASRPAVLTGRRLLVVEDEALIALTLKLMLEELGCTVVAMAGTLSKALELVQRGAEVDGAVLDVNLGGGQRVYPLADLLAEKGVPFVFATGYDRDGIDPRFRGVPVIAKPFEQNTLAVLLGSALH